MAKQKRDRNSQQHDRSTTPSNNEESKGTSIEDRADQAQSRIGSPSDVARKSQKRFGHN